MTISPRGDDLQPAARWLPRRHGPVFRVLAVLLVLLLTGPLFALAGAEELEDLIQESGRYVGDWTKRPLYNLSLDETLALAMDNNLDIAVMDYDRGISREGVNSARSQYDSAVTSNYFERQIKNQNADPFAGLAVVKDKTRQFDSVWRDPTIWGGTFQLFFLGNKRKSNISLLVPEYNANFNVQYEQSLLRKWGLEVNRAPIVIAQNNLTITESQFRDTVMTTAEAAEGAYWDLVFSRKDLWVRISSLELAEELLAINKAKVEVGTLAPIDVVQAEAGVASRNQELIVAVQAVLNAEDTIRQLINPRVDSPIWTSTLVPADSPDYEFVEVDESASIETAKKNRPDLEQQRLTIKNNNLQEMVDRKAKRWDLNFSGSYGTQGLTGSGDFVVDPGVPPDAGHPPLIPPTPGIPPTFETIDENFGDALAELDNQEFGDWRLQATLVIPIGNRDAKARYASSVLRTEQSHVQFDNVMLAAEIDVRRKVRDVKANIEQVKASTKNQELQALNVDAERKKYENGMSTSFTVLQVQDDAATAASLLAAAKVGYRKSLVALEKAKGTLLQYRNIQMASVKDDPYHRGVAAIDLMGIETGP